MLDECCFHKCVNRELFSKERTLHFKPPVGECVIFTYIIRGLFKPPVGECVIFTYIIRGLFSGLWELLSYFKQVQPPITKTGVIQRVKGQ